MVENIGITKMFKYPSLIFKRLLAVTTKFESVED